MQRILGIMAIAACNTSPSQSKTEGPAVAAKPREAAVVDLASINAAIPPGLAAQLSFEKTSVARKSPGRDVTYTVFTPKTWADGKLYKPTFAPATGDSSLEIGALCDGTCRNQDWNEVSERLVFSSRRNGKVLKEQHGPSNHLLVTTEDDMTYVVYAWWRDDGTPFNFCKVQLEAPLAAAVSAFEQACSSITLTGRV